MRARPHLQGGAWRKLGWLTFVAFTVKGLASTSLILWALISNWP